MLLMGCEWWLHMLSEHVQACACDAWVTPHIWPQAPLQNIAPDWRLGSKGCYDAASLARLQTTLELDFEAVAQGNITGCLSRPLGHGMEEALKAETLRADPIALGRLMADHTQVRLLWWPGSVGTLDHMLNHHFHWLSSLTGGLFCRV